MRLALFAPRLLPGALLGAAKDAFQAAWAYFKILIPLTIVLKIILELGWLSWCSLPLKPLCLLTGLPPELGVAWAAGILINLYSAMFLFVGILPQISPPSVEQMTVFSLMMLIAHSLPVEGRIAGQCGVSAWAQVGLRMGVALLTGIFLHLAATMGGFWAEPAVILFDPPPPPPGLLNWAWGEAVKLGGVAVIIFGVMLLQRALRHFRITDILGRVLGPLLRQLGMGPAAAVTVVIGFGMGLVYGSGVIIKETREGNLTQDDVFAAVTLISLCHALIEDTFLMGVIGANLWGTLGIRVLVSCLVCFALTRMRPGRRRAGI